MLVGVSIGPGEGSSEEAPKLLLDWVVDSAGDEGKARDSDGASPQLAPPGLLNLNFGLLLTIDLDWIWRSESGAADCGG